MHASMTNNTRISDYGDTFTHEAMLPNVVDDNRNQNEGDKAVVDDSSSTLPTCQSCDDDDDDNVAKGEADGNEDCLVADEDHGDDDDVLSGHQVVEICEDSSIRQYDVPDITHSRVAAPNQGNNNNNFNIEATATTSSGASAEATVPPSLNDSTNNNASFHSIPEVAFPRPLPHIFRPSFRNCRSASDVFTAAGSCGGDAAAASTSTGTSPHPHFPSPFFNSVPNMSLSDALLLDSTATYNRSSRYSSSSPSSSDRSMSSFMAHILDCALAVTNDIERHLAATGGGRHSWQHQEQRQQCNDDLDDDDDDMSDNINNSEDDDDDREGLYLHQWQQNDLEDHDGHGFVDHGNDDDEEGLMFQDQEWRRTQDKQ